MDELVVLLDGREAGRVSRKGDRLSFAYADAWRAHPDTYALSLSMPLTARSHPHEPINNFIWGLLPDNDRTLERWARQFRISARSSFALIGAVGEECAGAVQFVKPTRFERTQKPPGEGAISWIDEVEIGERLRSVLADAGSGRTAGDNGQFSLAGAQPKTALLKHGSRWGIPSGRVPTTHILKPPAENLPGHAENEHFCLTLARALGLHTVESDVLFFDGQPAICVERYDRFVLPGSPEPNIRRLHQEDMCQALGVHPDAKYQSEGGPSAAQIVNLIRNSVGGPMRAGMPLDRGVIQDMWTFVDALIFNWLIGGTDGHAKNYALLLGSQQLVRLAPLYDIASAYGFDDIAPQRIKLAMKVARHYNVEDIVLRHWRDWAKEAGLSPDAVADRVLTMAKALPSRLDQAANRLTAEGLRHPIIDKLAERLTTRATRVAAM